ncbi:hypothetical protein C1637_14120 [Chryseobacterium lactis]|uniref:Uncharacterized protein n=1 Tax=Chryseobacterium lactis TaxID=1241981 RepID=A0A3G6RIS7_CHRLC|nr:hypothetical protein [Chryseobacterium lactis]AZA83743.1 hypothetical protein EG342_18445 [Chryseobacterium lactis]AZB04128.1 hypothetical protein EG341_09320 [Chryseobacterium lactis]PNW12964.1 hypothetical protein C1637_14120 [Chryseobacterium lactis]
MTTFPVKLDYNSITLLISIIALIISIIALVYTIVSYLLKRGNKIRCDISTMSTIETNENYISSITLENLKDKATVIFEIYLRIGYNNFLLIEEFNDAPLILKPFEVYFKEYDPILFYTVNMDKMIINENLHNPKRKVILSTTEGKYIVKTNTKRWSVDSLFFTNYTTAVIQPCRLSYKDKNYGSNTLFLLILKNNGQEDYVKPILKNDYKRKVFVKFDLTEESIDNKENFVHFIQSQIDSGNLSYDSFDVLDFGKRVESIREEYHEDISIQPLSYLKYYINGRVITFIENLKIRRTNNRRRL